MKLIVLFSLTILGLFYLVKRCDKLRKPSVIFGVTAVSCIISAFSIYGLANSSKKTILSNERDIKVRVIEEYSFPRVISEMNVHERTFIEGLYTRAELDTLEEDYRLYIRAIDAYRPYVDSCGAEKVGIEESRFVKPVYKSSLGHGELDDYWKFLSNAVKRYNSDVEEYHSYSLAVDKKSSQLLCYEFFYQYVLALAIALQIAVAFAEYLNNEEKTKSRVKHSKQS